MKQILAVLVLVLLWVSAGLALRVHASSRPTQIQQPDALPALLTEVRALRVAMEQMASAGPRVQLALGRLQLQEQRVNTLLHRIESVQSDILKTSQENDRLKQEFADIEQRSKSPQVPPEEQRQLQGMLPQVRASWGRSSESLQRLQAEETTLTADLASEQGRWTDINRQLEELERVLARK